MRTIFLSIVLGLLTIQITGVAQGQSIAPAFHIGNGEIPNLAIDKQGRIYVVYGNKDQVLISISSDGAKSFSKPELVATVPGLFSYAMRGPQVAIASNGILVSVCDQSGNLYSFRKEGDGTWTKTGRLNDKLEAAKEGFVSMGADGQNAFAIWLDGRSGRKQVWGVKSIDGGKTWQKNQLVYKSPDTVVCECCKPSVIVREQNIYVMFRNRLHGYRDLYLIVSRDGGKSFGEAKKLGNGNWKLDGCPMDGGGLVVNEKGDVSTVWRRENQIYSCTPGQQEKIIDEGRNCSITNAGDKTVYSFTQKGEVIIWSGNQKKNLGKGSLPVLAAIDKNSVLCVWENEKQIYGAVAKIPWTGN